MFVLSFFLSFPFIIYHSGDAGFVNRNNEGLETTTTVSVLRYFRNHNLALGSSYTGNLSSLHYYSRFVTN